MTQPQIINWTDAIEEAGNRDGNEQRNVLLDFTAAPM